MQARQTLRRGPDEGAQRGGCEAEADEASHSSQGEAFSDELACGAAPACAESGADGEFLASAFHADQQQVSNIGAGDEQNEADGAHQHPEHIADVADDVPLERAQVGRKVHLLKQRFREAVWGREAVPGDGNEAGEVGAGLFHGNAGLEPRQRLVTVIAQMRFAAVPLERDDEVDVVVVKELEAARENADDLAGVAVHGEGLADDRSCAAEFLLPVAVGEHDGFGGSGGIVLAGEQAAKRGLDAEQGESAVGDVEAVDVFWLSGAGDIEGIAGVDADVFQGLALLAINEVVRGREVQVFDVDAGRGVPDADEPVGVGVGQRLEEDVLNHGEDDGVGADADG